MNRTSVSDEEKQATTRPDASINITNGAALSKRIGCGEVKAQYQALNHRLVGIDLMRIAVLAKAASDKHKLKKIFTFIVVGKLRLSLICCSYPYLFFSRANMPLSTYLLAPKLICIQCVKSHISNYLLPLIMCPFFFHNLTRSSKLFSAFNIVTLNSGNHNYANDPLTLTDNMLHNATNPKSSCKRKSITSHYNH